MLLGEKALLQLAKSRVAVFGVGGVGGYAVEVLARSGVGAIDLYDNDVVSPSNINRQIVATTSTIGRYKVDVAVERILDINPSCMARGFKMFYVVANADEVDLSQYDYVLDCIDTVSAKMELVRRCTALGVPIISSMGTGNKTHPELLRVSDISKTSVCPLARVMRRELSLRGIKHLKCVFSTEEPVKTESLMDGKKRVPGSTAFVPSVAGLLIASEVIRDLIQIGD